MNDPISRQSAIDVADYTDYTGLAIEDVKKVTDEVVKGLKRLPSIDAVPVVRCKDCIHSTSQVSDDEDNYYCNAMRRCMHSLDFCSYAERKES